MLKQPEEKIFDQYNDKSGAALIKIASRLRDEKLASLALDTLFSMDRPQVKSASFPSDTARDTFLSRIYFEGQREKMEKIAADEIEKRLEVAEALHSIPNRAQFRKTAETMQPGAAIALLPMCKIASKKELVQAGEDFCRDFEKLSSQDRRIFARNYVKTAALMNVETPDPIKLYACEDVEPREDIAEQILLRKVALEGACGDDHGFGELYGKLRQVRTEDLRLPELYKLAQTIDAADNLYGIREKGHGKTIPDAWHSVFQVKKAEISTPDVNVENMTKAEIISRFGEGALEEVENEEGEIDRAKLKSLVEAFGGVKQDADTGESNARYQA